MKILIVSQGPDGGGIHKSLTALLARLADMEKVEADVLLWRKPPSIPEEIVYTRNITPLEGLHGVKSFANCSSAGDFLRYGLFRALRPAGMETLCFHKPSKSYDIAIAYSQMGYSPHYVIDKVKAEKKILFFHHGSYDYSGYRRRLDAAYFKRFDRIATMSRANAEMLSTHFPGISNKISIVGNFINVDNILKLGQEKIAENASDTPVLTTVARLSGVGAVVISPSISSRASSMAGIDVATMVFRNRAASRIVSEYDSTSDGWTYMSEAEI